MPREYSLYISKFSLVMAYLMVLALSSYSQPVFIHHNKDGFAQVLQIKQDSSGFLWMSTSSTFARYDGYEIKSYTREDGSQLFGWPAIDNEGRVWVVPYESTELYAYEETSDSFKSYFPDISNLTITTLAFESSDVIWIGTLESGLFRYNLADEKIENHKIIFKDSTYQARSNLINYIHSENEYLLVGTSLGLWKFDKRSKSFSRPGIADENSLVYQRPIRKIFSFNDHFWFYLPKRLIKTDLNFNILKEFEFPSTIDADNMSQFSVDFNREGIFWIATYGQGLISYNSINDQTIIYRNDPLNKYSLASDILQCAYVDRNQNLWLGVFTFGLDQLKKQSISFKSISLPDKNSPGDIDILTTTHGSSILQSSKNTGLWVTSFSDINNIGSPKEFYINDELSKVHAAKSKIGKRHWWIGTWENGIYGIPLDPISGFPSQKSSLVRIVHDPNNPNTIQSNTAGIWYEDEEENLWISAPQNLLQKIIVSKYGKEGSVVKYQHDDNDSTSISKGNIWGILPANEGGLWVLTDSGLDLLKENKFKHIYKSKQHKIQPTHLSLTLNDELLISGNNTLVIISKWNGKYHAQEINAFSGKAIYSAQQDSLQRIWAAGEHGIYCYDQQNNLLFQFNEQDGLSSNEFFPTSVKIKNNAMLFTSNNSVVLFDPLSLQISKSKPRVILTGLKVNNKLANLNTSKRDENTEFTLGQNISKLPEIVLSHVHRIFTLEFASTDLTSPQKTRYKFKLEGFDPDWVETNWTNRSATYTNLDPGNYRFKIIASNPDGIWSDLETSLAVKVLPPPWRTWWAYTGYLMLVAGLLVWARSNIVKQERLNISLRLANLEQERKNFELEKAKEVDKVKTSFFTNISHEFRTPLTLIKGPVQDLLEKYTSDPKTQQKLKMVQRNSDLLLKLINQLLDLAKLESGTLKVEKSEGDIYSFIRAIASSFSSFAAQKNVTINVDVPAESCYANFDKDKLETILINLINNAIKFTQPNGSVTVSAMTEEAADLPAGQAEAQSRNDSLTLKVTDTGIGISEEHQRKIFERFHQVSEAHKEVGTGVGLALVKEIVTLLGGTITLESKPGEGSEFIVIMPIEEVKELTAISESNVSNNVPISESEPVSLRPSKTDTTEASFKSGFEKLSLTNPESATHEDKSKPHVLVVEDNNDLRAFIIDCLGEEFSFLQAENGKIGLAIAAQEIPDMIISDVMMPEMDGITMAEKIKKDIRTSHIPLILLTAKSTEDSKLQGLQSGADDYLTKPFNKQELLLKIRNGVSRQLKLRERLRADLMSTAPKVEVLSADEQFLNNVKEEILKRLSDEQLSVESLAEDMNMSRVQLYRKITGLTGMSVNELIRKLRLQRAAQLLQQKWGPVSQVAYEVGFSNLSYFSKVFKDEFGVLPSEYSSTNS